MESDRKTPVFNDCASIGREVVSLDRAIALFDRLADRTDIAFGYANDGCYARAHLMCLMIDAEGLMPRKAWAFEDGKSLEVKMPDGKAISWWYHVSAALPVKMPDGVVQDMVFDPGLFDGPVSLAEWGDTMRAKPSRVSIEPFTQPPEGTTVQYGPGQSESIPAAYKAAVGTMSNYLKWQDAGPRTVFQSQIRQQFSQTQAGSAGQRNDLEIGAAFGSAKHLGSKHGHSRIQGCHPQGH